MSTPPENMVIGIIYRYFMTFLYSFQVHEGTSVTPPLRVSYYAQRGWGGESVADVAETLLQNVRRRFLFGGGRVAVVDGGDDRLVETIHAVTECHHLREFDVVVDEGSGAKKDICSGGGARGVAVPGGDPLDVAARFLRYGVKVLRQRVALLGNCWGGEAGSGQDGRADESGKNFHNISPFPDANVHPYLILHYICLNVNPP